MEGLCLILQSCFKIQFISAARTLWYYFSSYLISLIHLGSPRQSMSCPRSWRRWWGWRGWPRGPPACWTWWRCTRSWPGSGDTRRCSAAPPGLRTVRCDQPSGGNTINLGISSNGIFKWILLGEESFIRSNQRWIERESREWVAKWLWEKLSSDIHYSGLSLMNVVNLPGCYQSFDTESNPRS